MTNAKTVYEYGIIVGHIFAMLDNASSGVTETRPNIVCYFHTSMTHIYILTK